jgi:glycosyltransferase involved in cell wall biosynthesis
MIISLQKVQKMRSKTTKRKVQVKYSSLADLKSVMQVTGPVVSRKPTGAKPPYTVNWVMSPPRGGGGHQNIFRFINYLDSKGYTNNVYLYSTSDFITVEEVKTNIRSYCTAENITIQWLKGDMASSDVVFATGWETAYPVVNARTDAKKMYFVQDFEPYFYPVGSDYILAENTYKFGLTGITAGKWLTHKLSQDYGMQCDSYDFGADPGVYAMTNAKPRKKVFFYARPVTTRRGFELGIMALTKFHEAMPDYEIVMAGWDISEYELPFPCTNLKALPLSALSDVYNECAVALVISLTNMSLLPLELLAAGVIPVVNNGENNTMVSASPFIAYADATPHALAQAMIDTLKKKDLVSYAKQAAKSTAPLNWGPSCEKFEKILIGHVRG